jgi:hypothetical protein
MRDRPLKAAFRTEMASSRDIEVLYPQKEERSRTSFIPD